jgi:hypothetical protein
LSFDFNDVGCHFFNNSVPVHFASRASLNLFSLLAALSDGLALPMQEITIRLWRNTAGDWSVEINGQRHEHVPTEVMESLVESALIVAEESLVNISTKPLQ